MGWKLRCNSYYTSLQSRWCFGTDPIKRATSISPARPNLAYINKKNVQENPVRFNVNNYKNLYHQHGVTIAEEAIFLLDGGLIGFNHQIVTGEGAGHDHKTCLRQVETGNERI